MSVYKNVYTDYISAVKNKKDLDKNVLSLLYNNLKNEAINTRVTELADTNAYSVIRKLSKELAEEIECNVKVNRTEKVNELTYQKNLIEAYLPAQLSEDKIKEIINTLDDKSVPSVMKYFKTNYNGQVDMGLVNKLIRNA